jgi:hypothetical protein
LTSTASGGFFLASKEDELDCPAILKERLSMNIRYESEIYRHLPPQRESAMTFDQRQKMQKELNGACDRQPPNGKVKAHQCRSLNRRGPR